MAQLSLTKVSDDGKQLLLRDASGAEFTVEISPALRSAVLGAKRETPRRFGQKETTMDSALRPRDIQARIRAGEDPQTVAEAANSTVEKIMPFAGPVMAERQHMADRAQRSSLRRGGESGARVLGEAVATSLAPHGVEPDDVEWDSYRRGDGKWALVADFFTTARNGSAHFTYDPPGNYVTVDNDDAKWLIGEALPVEETPAGDDLQQARQRRLNVVPEDELPLGDDAISLVAEPEQPALIEQPPLVEESSLAEPVETPAADLDEQPMLVPDDTPTMDGFDAVPAEDEDQEPVDEIEEPLRRPVQKKKGRASVPSWDEIMFGGSDQ